jgi:uncharacterized membrane protein
MATLIAIGYDNERTAAQAADEVRRLSHNLLIQPDAVAVIRRDLSGAYHVATSHHAVGAGATWGMFWGFLFGLLFFVPVFGVAVGAGLGALLGEIEKGGVDKALQQQVRDMVSPGTSALFLIVERVTPEKALAALSKFGGKVLKASLTEDQRQRLEEALHGSMAGTPA